MTKILALLGIVNPLPAIIAVAIILLGGFAGCESMKYGFAVHKRAVAAEGERDGVIKWADVVCALTGAPFREPKREDWGKKCGNQVQFLAAFHTQTLSQANKALADDVAARLKKQDADLVALRTQNSSMAAAMKRLSEAKANVKADLYGPDYLGALDLAAGLQPPGRPGGDPPH